MPPIVVIQKSVGVTTLPMTVGIMWMDGGRLIPARVPWQAALPALGSARLSDASSLFRSGARLALPLAQR